MLGLPSGPSDGMAWDDEHSEPLGEPVEPDSPLDGVTDSGPVEPLEGLITFRWRVRLPRVVRMPGMRPEAIAASRSRRRGLPVGFESALS